MVHVPVSQVCYYPPKGGEYAWVQGIPLLLKEGQRAEARGEAGWFSNSFTRSHGRGYTLIAPPALRAEFRLSHYPRGNLQFFGRDHSSLRAVNGSMRDARLVGIHEASKAIAARTAVATTNVAMSKELTP